MGILKMTFKIIFRIPFEDEFYGSTMLSFEFWIENALLPFLQVNMKFLQLL